MVALVVEAGRRRVFGRRCPYHFSPIDSVKHFQRWFHGGPHGDSVMQALRSPEEGEASNRVRKSDIKLAKSMQDTKSEAEEQPKIIKVKSIIFLIMDMGLDIFFEHNQFHLKFHLIS